MWEDSKKGRWPRTSNELINKHSVINTFMIHQKIISYTLSFEFLSHEYSVPNIEHSLGRNIYNNLYYNHLFEQLYIHMYFNSIVIIFPIQH